MLIDGVFDMTHSGHYNAIRQAKSVTKHLVVAVNCEKEVIEAKGAAPIFTEDERMIMIKACKWVDEVPDHATPYVPTLQLLDDLNCQYIGHGDDIILGDDGKSIYTPFVESKRMKIVKRTEGISTTDILGRILDLKLDQTPEEIAQSLGTDSQDELESHFILQSSKLQKFMTHTEPKTGDKIVYVAGSFDLLNPGHIKFLEKARALGDYLIVGVHSD